MACAAAVVVTYNSEDVIEGCLAALAKFAPEMRVIVVDNASTDQTMAMVHRGGVDVIANAHNAGFAAAANRGFEAAQETSFVLLMNPDVRLQTGIASLIERAAHQGIAGGRLISEDGSTQAGFTIRRFPTVTVLALELLGINRLWPSNPSNSRYRYLDRDLTQSGPADQPAGAFLMIRRDVWTNLNGFDETFWPIWFEDVDFCRRAASAGNQPYFVTEAMASHVGGHSIKKLEDGRKQLYWHDSLLKYVRKHFGKTPVRLLCITAGVGAIPRMIGGVIQERSLRPVANGFRNLKFLGKRLVRP